MLPPQVTIVPLYVMWAKLHLVGTLWPLIIPNWFGDAFSIFLLRQFFLTIPRGVPRRRARRRLRRAADPDLGRLPAGQAGDRRGRAVLVPLTASTTSSGRCSTRARTRRTGRCRSGLAQFRTLHQVQWNLTMAATLLVHGAGDHPVLPRPEGVRRGRDADGGEGVKVAVDRRRARPTRPSSCPGSRASASGSTSASSCCTTSTPSGCEVVGGLARRMLDARRVRAARSTLTGDLDAALDGADFVLIQIRVGGQAARLARRDGPARRAAASARRRPAPAASPRRCGRCRWCSRSPSACASWPRRRRLDRRLHEPGRDRHARAARRRPPRGRALQRRDRLPARARAAARRRARARRSSTRSGSTTSPGCARCGSTARTCSPELLAEPRRRARRRRVGAAAAAARRARRGAVLLPALLLRARPRAGRAARRATPRASEVAGDRARAARAVPRPGARPRSRRCSSSAAARSTARRRSGSSRSLAAGDGDGPRGRRRATAARSPGWPTTTSSRCPARVGRDGAGAAAAAAARAGAARARPARRGLRAAGRRRPRVTRRRRRRRARRCSRIR